jgi:hypothetical protein
MVTLLITVFLFNHRLFNHREHRVHREEFFKIILDQKSIIK